MATTSFLGSTTAAVSLNGLKPSSAAGSSQQKGPLLIKASISPEESSRRNILKLAAGVLVGGIISSASGNANASLVDDLLAKSAANKDLNDKKRLATSGANLARAYTVTFGTCKFPENFTGCQDLAKKTDVKFLTEDLKVECEGKDKYKCGSNVFWKWGK